MTPPRTTKLLVDLTPQEARALARAANLLSAAVTDAFGVDGIGAAESGAMKLEVALIVAGEEPA